MKVKSYLETCKMSKLIDELWEKYTQETGVLMNKIKFKQAVKEAQQYEIDNYKLMSAEMKWNLFEVSIELLLIDNLTNTTELREIFEMELKKYDT